MGLKREFVVGVLFGAVLAAGLSACASGFGYKFYGLELIDYSEGTLMGPEPKDDLPVLACKPTLTSARPCTCFLTPEFEMAKAELMDLRDKLKECQSNQ